MEKQRQPSLCDSCEYCWDTAFPSVRYYVGGELKAQLEGFSDRPNGPPVQYPARLCEHEKVKGRALIYEALPSKDACPHYRPSSWDRPETCGECQRRQLVQPDGSFHCAGFPFRACHKSTDAACVNGKVKKGAQLTLF